MPTDQQPRWRDETGLTAWARERLDAVGLSPSGVPERHTAKPWGRVLRWDLPSGRWWLKATGPGMRHEPALVAALASWAPEHVLTPVAVEPRRGWLVLPDGGPTLRERYGHEHDLGHWERLLPSFAQLQREVAPHVEEMLAVGVPDLRVEQLTAELDAALALDAHELGVGAEDGPTTEELDLVRAARPRIAAWVDELASYRVPVSVQHDDVHDANVFVSVDGNLRVFDWGDASVAPVVTSLLIALRASARLLEVPYGSPELLRLRDAYLEVWSDLVPAEELRAATAVALRLGAISRSRCYVRSLMDATADEAEPYRGAVGGWLVELLAPTPLDPV